jgi:4-amino-4-deoxy-L-arabinose transferase-like glycosyltransferase
MTKPESAFRIDRSSLRWLLFAIVIVFVYFFGLTVPLLGPDEPRYSQVAREMFLRGDWVTPTLGGYHWFEKPALLYWLQIASYNLFGVSEFSARFGSALFGLGTVASLWVLGRSVTTEDTESTEFGQVKENFAVSSVTSVVGPFANWLALIAASTIGIIVFARGASFDIILTFPMTAAMVSFFVYDVKQRHGKAGATIALLSFYFFVGVALLAKGLIGIVFPFAIIAFYHLLSWRFPDGRFILSLFWGSVVTAVVAATWYLPMYLRHGYEFIDEFFIQHHFQRYTSNKYFHPQPFYFFFWVLPLMTIPWMPFFFIAVWKGIRRFVSQTGRRGETVSSVPLLPYFPAPLLRFAFAWLLVPLVFFSFSGSKLPGYILPAVPPAIVVTALYLWPKILQSQKWRALVQFLAAGTFVVVVALLAFVVPYFADHDSVKSLIASADERGYANAKVLSLHNVSHNAEFYAAGRLLRAADGKQQKFNGADEILSEIRRQKDNAVLVLVPPEKLKELTDNPQLDTEVIGERGELAIAAVTAK